MPVEFLIETFCASNADTPLKVLPEFVSVMSPFGAVMLDVLATTSAPDWVIFPVELCANNVLVVDAPKVTFPSAVAVSRLPTVA